MEPPADGAKQPVAPTSAGRLAQVEAYWSGLFYNLADGRASEYAALDRLGVVAFYRHVALWRKQLENLKNK